MNMGGSLVVLDGSRSYTQNKKSGQKMRIVYEGDQYVTYLWVPSNKEIAQEESERILKVNKYAILATESTGAATH